MIRMFHFIFKSFLLVGLLFFSFPLNVFAIEISLEDWVFNVDGVSSEFLLGDEFPAVGSFTNGLGQFALEISGEGSHKVIGYFDLEIHESANTFFNEFGNISSNSPSVGQSWEIDEPGFFYGDILDNVFSGDLDFSNGVQSGAEDDVAFALGWDFVLLSNEVAVIDFIFTNIVPASGFYLSQTDPELSESVYFYSALSIIGDNLTNGGDGPLSVAEPKVSYLLLGLVFIFWCRLCRFRARLGMSNVTQ